MILVTGGTGCVGGHVVSDLNAGGEPVRLLVHEESPNVVPRPGVEIVVGDVRDARAIERAMTGCRTVVHIAGAAGLNATDGARMRSINVGGTLVVAASARRHGAHMVHMSSASAVGLVRDLLIDETCTAELPRHPYPRSKRAGERAVLEEAARGLSAVILNPGAVLATGGAAANTWSGMAAAVRRGAFPLAPPGGFGFVSRQTLVAGVRAAVDGAGGTTAERYLIVDENLSHRDLIERIAARVGMRAPRGTAPAPLLGAACAVGRVTGPDAGGLLHPDNLPFLTWRVTYDGSRARRVLGVPPTPIDHAIEELTAQEAA
jgi:dihydroflavonol-4-reductase